MEKMLSNEDVNIIANSDLPVILSPDLSEYNSIQELLNEDGKALILYQNYHDGNVISGHWVGLKEINNGDGDDDEKDIIYFDPYGYFVDDALDYIPESYKEQTNQMTRELSKLLYYSPYKNIHYNEHVFQGPDSNTCGRHTGIFLRLDNVDIDGYHRGMKNLKETFNIPNYDKLIVDITENII